MSERNFPLPPSRGRLLYKYEDVQKYDVSIFQLYDLMERFYQRKVSGSDKEARNYQNALEQKIKLMSNKSDILTVDDKDENQTDKDSETLDEDDPLLRGLTQIADLYKKKQTDKKDTLQKLKNDFHEELRHRFITHEYNLLSKEIENSKINKLEDSDTGKYTSNSSIEEEDVILESTPSMIHTLRTGSYSARKKINQLEDKHKKSEKELKIKTRKLEELDQQIKKKKEELETKEQELLLKKEQIEEYLNELKQYEDKRKSDESTQTEDSQNEYSLVSAGSDDEENEELDNSKEEITTGHKLLEKEFIRHGRKTWNDKDVTNFLRNYKKQNSASPKQQSTLQLDMQKITIEVTATIKTIFSITQDLTETLNSYHDKILNELETVRNSKNKYTSFQTYQEQYKFEMQGKLHKLQQYCEKQTETLQSIYYESQENQTEQLRKHLLENMEKQFKDQTKKLDEIIKALHPQNERSRQEPMMQTQKIKKLILIPNENMEISQVSKIIREEAKKSDKPPEIKNIRKTTNNNIELKSSEKEIDTISKLLENKQDNFTIIHPEERAMKILLLKINKDITKEELEDELTKRKYLETFTILKSIEIQKTSYNNWVVEAPAADCRKMVKMGKVKLFYEVFIVEFYIRVMRCTNCQELNNHVKSQCEFRTRCAKCSGKHETSGCEDKVTKCINCIRYNKNEVNHPAYSPQCPIFQYEKDKRLKEYYKSKEIFPNMKTLTRENKDEIEKMSRRNYKREDQHIGNQPSENRIRGNRYENDNKYDNNYTKSKEYTNNRYGRSDNQIKYREDEVKDRYGETRTITMRTFENSNRKNHNYTYPKYTREALPPSRR